MNLAHIALITATVCLSTPALAQEAQDFSGFYVGGIAGYDSSSIGGGGVRESRDGVVYGVIAGYDADLHGTIIGLEAEFNDASTKVVENNVLVAGDEARLSAGRDFYIGTRAGFLAGPSTIVYGKAGYTNARVNASYVAGASSLKDHVDLGGFRVGAGVEHSFGRFSARAEYRYSDYSDFSFGGFATGVDLKRHQVVAGLLAKF